jgi:ribose transport system ATP-binding protein
MATATTATLKGPAANTAGPVPLLEVEKLSKHFPGVVALDRVDFELAAGEVHVLFGENGAGKSTLIQTLAGAHQPTEGVIRFRGAPVVLETVHQARGLGISAVFQEFSLVPTLTVEENMFLGAERTRHGFLDRAAVRRGVRKVLDDLGFPLKPDTLVQYLSRAEQQMLEIAKAFRTDLSVLILDEPTASLTERETDRLFALIEQAKARGVGIIYITHRMNEIRRVGDRITVLRDGRCVATLPVGEANEERLLQLMTGRVITQVFPKIAFRPGRPLLELERITTMDGSVTDMSLTVRAGEIVGLAGLVGCGKSEAGRAAFGLEPIAAGRIRYDGIEIASPTPRRMLDRGLFYLPPDRRTEGLVMPRSVRENISLPWLGDAPFSRLGLLNRMGEIARVTDLARQLNLQPLRVERDVEHFSGGNQQKVLLAKGLSRAIKLFVLDEPTVGVDVGTRVAIYGFIRDLCQAGAGILLISSDLPEILHLTNRTYVMHRGRPNGELAGEAITQDAVLGCFFERQAA